ncbi:MAG: transposase [Planctomycetes bacterium]|nr:transposase [Planctomycetota bacterium]
MALIERFWRSMKDEYARGLFLYRPLRPIERDLLSFVSWFNRERPHQGLAHRTPDEVYRGRSVAGDRRLPILRLRRAA